MIFLYTILFTAFWQGQYTVLEMSYLNSEKPIKIANLNWLGRDASSGQLLK